VPEQAETRVALRAGSRPPRGWRRGAGETDPGRRASVEAERLSAEAQPLRLYLAGDACHGKVRTSRAVAPEW
jgi:hypothetical protein